MCIRDRYEVIDGMWRFTACKHLGHLDIPCIVREGTTDEEVVRLQIQANAVSYETRPIEFANQMKRLIRMREKVGAPISIKELAAMVSKSTAWVSARLRLLELHPDLQQEISEGTMGIGKATALAKIKKDKYQLKIWQEHKDLNTKAFEIEVGKFLQKVYFDMNESKNTFEEKAQLIPVIQSMDSLLIELDRMEEISQIIVKRNLTTALEGAKVAIEWALNLHETGRQRQVSDKRFLLKDDQRREIIGKQRYDELTEMRKLREERMEREREDFN